MKVQETFQKTIQGEGFWSGTPCDFIRLYGCPVGCPWCDTGYADGGEGLTFFNVEPREIALQTVSDRVVITGGEPFVNPGLISLIQALKHCGRKIHIETSGIRYQDVPDVWITLSPKEHTSSSKVDDRFWGRADEVKIVVQSVADFELYLDRIDRSKPVFVQPCDTGLPLEQSIKPVLEIVEKYQWVRLGLQLHKIIGVQ